MKKYLLFSVVLILAAFQGLDAQVLYGPVTTPPGGLFSEMTGVRGDNLVGTTAGKSYTFSAIKLLDQTEVFFGSKIDSIELSLDGSDFVTDGTVQENLQFSLALSDLPGGVLAWTGTTRLPESATTPVYTRFYMRFTSGGVVLPLVDAVPLGLDPYVGGVPDLTPGAYFTVNFQFQASYSESTSFIPHLDFYNANSLTENLAYASVGWGWYWNNSKPVIEKILTISVNEMDTVIVSEQFLQVNDVESDSTMVYFEMADVPEALPANGTVYRGSNMLTEGSIFTKEDLMKDSIFYIHDGSETTMDSIALRVYDSDQGYYSMGDDTTFYIVFAITPVDDLPLVEVNMGLTLDEEAEMAISSAYLLTTDSESENINITYTIDPDDEGIWPKNGQLRKSSVPLSSGDTFTQDDIENGLITYKHDGSMTITDGFIFSVVDEFGHPAEQEDGTALFFFEITVTPVNDNPVFTTNIESELDAWGEVTIVPDKLSATDEESDNDGIFFNMDPETIAPSTGEMRLSGMALEPGDSFSMQDIIDGNVTYKNFNSNDDEIDKLVFSITDEDGGMYADGDFTIFNHVFLITMTGKDLFETIGLNVYPNPGMGVYRISGLEGVKSYEIYSATGQEIRSARIDQSRELLIDISGEPSGIYLLQLKDADKIVGSFRLLVR